MNVTPPFFEGLAPALRCNRALSTAPDIHDPTTYCGEPATWHIIWNLGTMDNGIVCDPHMDEAKRNWAYFAAHPYAPACSMPGAMYDEVANECWTDEEGLGLRESVVVPDEQTEGGGTP